MNERETAARRFAREYYKATGKPVRTYIDYAKDVVIEDGYVHWLEDQLCKILDGLHAEITAQKAAPRSALPAARPPMRR
jgi:hypothetical protein